MCRDKKNKLKLLVPSSFKMLGYTPLLFLIAPIADHHWKSPSFTRQPSDKQLCDTQSNRKMQQEQRLWELNACQHSHTEQKLR